MGPNKNVDMRTGRSPRKVDHSTRIRERSARPGPLKISSNSPTPPKSTSREAQNDVGPSRTSDSASFQNEEDGVFRKKPPDDEEFWRMMKYEEKRLKDAGQDQRLKFPTSQCVSILLEKNNEDLVLSCVYGETTVIKRRELWAHLNSLKHGMVNTPWACIGDFNAYTCFDDKMGGSGPNLASMEDFVVCLDDCRLFDLGFQGPKFTWSNGHIQERIDRCVVNKG